MTKRICIYHNNCADGFTAAWVVNKIYGSDCIFIGATYNEPPPTNIRNREVIITDFSYKKRILEEMASQAQSILILDHHKSAAEELKGYPAPPVGNGIATVFDMQRSGARITWDYYFPDMAPPKLLLHVEDRDLWRFELEGTKEIQAALFSYPYSFDVWTRLMESDCDSLYQEGRVIVRKHTKDINELIKVAKRKMRIGGFLVPVLNAPYFYSSEACHIMAESEPFAACYWDSIKGREFSLRSNENGIDVSLIAGQYGGGGHQHAAGFRMPIGWEGDDGNL